MSDEEIWQFVADANRGIFVTLRRDGVPIALPMGFVAVDRHIYMRSRGKKNDRLKNDPRSAFLVETGERWSELKAVHFTGHSEMVAVSGELRERIESELARKYAATRTPLKRMPEATRAHYEQADRGFVRFTPDDRILNWDNAKLRIAGA